MTHPGIFYEVGMLHVLAAFRAIPDSSVAAVVRRLKPTRGTVSAREAAVKRAIKAKGLLEWVSGGDDGTYKCYSLTAKGVDELERLEFCQQTRISREFSNRALDAILADMKI